MTLQAIVRLVAFNAFVLGVGLGVLWGIRGWRTGAEVLRLAGLAYLLGVSALFVLFTVELVLGIPFGPVAVVATGGVLVLAGVAVARRRVSAGGRGDGLGAPFDPSLVAGFGVAAVVVYLESLFRVGRLAGFGWDDWASWVPRAKSIFFFERVDPELFASLPGGSYPPGLPILNAAAFHAMGSADAVTVHLQHWFYGVGFAAAIIGLLSTRSRAWLLYPLVLLVLIMPDLRNRAIDLYGDVPLGYLLATSALLALLWITDRHPWQLVSLSVLLAGAMSTKREGMLFAVCIVAAALAATWSQRRRLWPRLVLAGLAAFVVTLPWRVWFTLEGLPSDAPQSGYVGWLRDADRVLPSLELVVQTILDYDLWLLAPALGIAAIVLVALAGARTEAVYAAVLVATSVAGCVWIYWSNPTLEIGTSDGLVNRVVGTPALMLGVLTPVLLELVWRARTAPRGAVAPERDRPRPARVALASAVVLAAAITYPVVALGGEAPRFPRAEDCVVGPVSGERVRVVFGYRDTFPEAIELRDRALGVGFVGTVAEQDGCGRVRVLLDDVPTLEIGQEIVREADTVDLEPTLEHDPDE